MLGVYFANDGNISMGNYARGGALQWSQTEAHVNSCVTLAEIINLPQEFRSATPFLVVPQTHWIVW